MEHWNVFTSDNVHNSAWMVAAIADKSTTFHLMSGWSEENLSQMPKAAQMVMTIAVDV